MKKLLIFILLLNTTLYSFSQTVIDTRLTPYVIEYIRESELRNIDTQTGILQALDTIKISDELRYPMLGLNLYRERKILITPYVLHDSIKLRAVVFHELTHTFLIGHSCEDCNQIMSSRAKNNFERWRNESEWQKDLDVMFMQIRNGKY